MPFCCVRRLIGLLNRTMRKHGDISWSTSADWPQGSILRLAKCMPMAYFNLTTPRPIVRCSRSGYFKRAFSACSFVTKGFERGVKLPLTYL